MILFINGGRFRDEWVNKMQVHSKSVPFNGKFTMQMAPRASLLAKVSFPFVLYRKRNLCHRSKLTLFQPPSTTSNRMPHDMFAVPHAFLYSNSAVVSPHNKKYHVRIRLLSNHWGCSTQWVSIDTCIKWKNYTKIVRWHTIFESNNLWVLLYDTLHHMSFLYLENYQ